MIDFNPQLAIGFNRQLVIGVNPQLTMGFNLQPAIGFDTTRKSRTTAARGTRSSVSDSDGSLWKLGMNSNKGTADEQCSGSIYFSCGAVRLISPVRKQQPACRTPPLLPEELTLPSAR